MAGMRLRHLVSVRTLIYDWGSGLDWHVADAGSVRHDRFTYLPRGLTE